MNTAEYRPLTVEERDLLVWLLEHGGPEARNFLPQLEVIQARPSCGCGCPSIEFIVPIDAPYIHLTDGISGHFAGRSADRDVGLILFAGSGVLSELEVFTFGGIDHPFGLPNIETLRVTNSDSAPGPNSHLR